MNIKKIIVWLGILAVIGGSIGYVVYKGGSRQAYTGIRLPVQTEAEGITQKTVGEYTVNITYLYHYDIEALVVHTKDYFGWNVDDQLSNKDLALAWGTVAQYNNDIDFHWDQSGRWYSWRVNSMSELAPVGGVSDVSLQSSNNHIIPADDSVRQKVNAIRRGDHIRLQGYLVNVDGLGKGGKSFQWHSSTSRSDGGAHSCEVIYVTDVEWV